MAGKTVRHADIQPTHPGEILKEDVIPALRLSVAAMAGHLKVSRQTLHRIVSGEAAVTPEMALRIGKLCGNGPGFWLRLQEAYDLWHAEKRLAPELAAIPTLEAVAA